MSKIINVYKIVGAEEYQLLNEEELYKMLHTFGNDREIEYIKSFGGKDRYDNALKIQNNEVSKPSINNLSINKKEIAKVKKCKLVKKAMIGMLIITVIGTASYFDNKYGDTSTTTQVSTTVDYKDYVKLYYFVKAGDTFESISERFNTNDIKSPIIPNTFVELTTDRDTAKAYLVELNNIPMGYIYYVVKKYETPANIAEGFYISRTQLWIDNDMEPGEDFKEGDSVKIGVYSLNQMKNGPKFEEVEVPFIKLLELKQEILSLSLEPVTNSRAR